MDIKIVNESGEEQSPNHLDEHHSPDNSSYDKTGELDRIAVAQVLDLDFKEIDKFKEKIQTLVDWAKTKGEVKSPMDLKWIIKNLEARVGSPNFGETRIAKLSRYAYLDMEGKRIEAEKMSLVD